MIDDLFVRYKKVKVYPYYIEKAQLIFQKNKKRIFHKSEFCLIDDLDQFSLYPNFGNVYIRKMDNETEYIMRLDQILFHYEQCYSGNCVIWSCKTNDKDSPFRLLTIGRDTFANHFINLNDFIDKHHVTLLTDIIVGLEYNMFSYIFMKYLGKNGKPKRLLIKERFDENGY